MNSLTTLSKSSTLSIIPRSIPMTMTHKDFYRLFPLAKWFGDTRINQRERIDSFSLSRTIFLVLLVVSLQSRQHLPRSNDRPLSPSQKATSFTHGRTTLAVSHTSNLLQWHTHMVREHLARNHDRPLPPSQKNTLLLASDTHIHTLLTNPKTNILTGNTKKDTFPIWVFYSYKHNKPFVDVFSKEVSLFICVVQKFIVLWKLTISKH